jgi:hypothetical protein
VLFRHKIILFVILFVILSKFVLELPPSPSKTNKHNPDYLPTYLASTNHLGLSPPTRDVGCYFASL